MKIRWDVCVTSQHRFFFCCPLFEQEDRTEEVLGPNAMMNRRIMVALEVSKSLCCFMVVSLCKELNMKTHNNAGPALERRGLEIAVLLGRPQQCVPSFAPDSSSENVPI